MAELIQNIQTLYASNWKDYELIDIGNGEKLERFGSVTTIRPEPLAIWNAALDYKQWEKQAHLKFNYTSSKSGSWQKIKSCPEQWALAYNHKGLKLKFKLKTTNFKHLGVFPEQSAHWDRIYDFCVSSPVTSPKVLNLFAYTGGASLAAKAGGADVIHLDSIKNVVSWANENQELSDLNGIRWMVEDAVKFVDRSVKRGTKFNGIILDPPAFGQGTKNTHWKLDKDLPQFLANILKLLDNNFNFLILNTYSLGLSSVTLLNMIHSFAIKSTEFGELVLKSKTGLIHSTGNYLIIKP